jgi:hypothetical protein
VAQGQEVTTREGVLVQITLGATSSVPGTAEAILGSRLLIVTPDIERAAAVAGSVSDASVPRDGLGDEHTPMPSGAPILVAAAVDASGGPGSNGTIRVQIEWEIAKLALTPLAIASAEVLLHTDKGSVDSLDTTFHAGTADQDGVLADADFQAPAAPIPGAVMPVPDGPPGTAGTFAFDVTAPLRQAVARDRSHFSIQGRVDESLTGGGFQRGLQVHTTATGPANPPADHPQLRIALAGGAPEFVFAIDTLPLFGTLLDSNSSPVLAPRTLPSPTLTYVPFAEFNGLDQFRFTATDGVTTDVALVKLVIQPAVIPPGEGGPGSDCDFDPDDCDNGR